MKIRWKILLILLMFSLLPLIIIRAHGLNTLTDLGSDLQTQTRVTLLERATDNLAQMAEGTAARLNLEDRLYRTTIKTLQNEAENLLTKNVPSTPHSVPFITTPKGAQNIPKLYVHPDYKKSAMMGRGMRLQQGNQTISHKKGDLIDLPISTEHISFWLSQGLSTNEAIPSINKLTPLLHTFQACSQTLNELALWQEIALETGLQATFPAHKSIPPRYDPRISHWYKEVKKTLQTLWTDPAPDPATKSLCYRLSSPLFNDKDEFIGAASLVVPVGTAISSALLMSTKKNVKIMMVLSDHKNQANKEKLLVVGRNEGSSNEKASIQARGHLWQIPPEPEWIYESNPEFTTLVKDITIQQSGVLQIKDNGIPSLWTYSPINKSLALLVIIPITDFTAEADEAEQYVSESISRQIKDTTLIALSIIAVLGFVAYFVSQNLSSPIRRISEAVIKVGQGDWGARAELHSKDELGELAENFNLMVPQLREHSSILQALSLADEAQQNLLPKSTPKFSGAEIGAKCVFSEKTGGDYFDFIDCATCGNDIFATAIGDVSGHGVSAALLMTSARAYIRALTGQGRPLVEVVSKVNTLITEDCAQTGHFMTLFTAICDTKKKTINWIRAGHDPALIYDPKTDSFDELIKTGLAIGVDEYYLYKENFTQLKAGQILTLYTDGIWEAHSPKGEQFGKLQLREIIRDCCDKPAQEIVEEIHKQVSDHRRGLPLEDDCTVIIIKFL
ncbi:SpoIIE family protein phosphatase [Maridesulfovibrio ferrireducens]|uniref:SpoIIE family protein phosphatase n=1 Tax=Maridesulfovibrio ferrireducens TaxID=246191 RepID=UPI001A21E592|nr:SpoIIE family protein phosphatase [Maridesulfovibrio ferrireducens]MBI9113008.1 SpoIIE family protein phosphatase [Maridesulfovibrio ferrireducens]